MEIVRQNALIDHLSSDALRLKREKEQLGTLIILAFYVSMCPFIYLFIQIQFLIFRFCQFFLFIYLLSYLMFICELCIDISQRMSFLHIVRSQTNASEILVVNVRKHIVICLLTVH